MNRPRTGAVPGSPLPRATAGATLAVWFGCLLFCVAACALIGWAAWRWWWT